MYQKLKDASLEAWDKCTREEINVEFLPSYLMLSDKKYILLTKV